MKFKVLLFIIFALVVLGMVGYGYFKSVPGPENQGGTGPKIEITPKVFDFGDINYGDIVNYEFTVKNFGMETLEIKRVATSCPCASVKIAKEKIEPGEEVGLLVSYDSGAMGLHGKERQERIIYVRSNDSVNPQAEVRIYANVK